MMQNTKTFATIAFWLSVVALVAATVVSVFQINLWLAGTQWILIAIALAVYALYFGERQAPGA
ncbi:MAG: hypothetical protein NT136_02445 [Candidatus Moranbacteria bacterium]|nr:hypothetical protein [Candidatus Moranbacteria bacterium]